VIEERTKSMETLPFELNFSNKCKQAQHDQLRLRKQKTQGFNENTSL